MAVPTHSISRPVAPAAAVSRPNRAPGAGTCRDSKDERASSTNLKETLGVESD